MITATGKFCDMDIQRPKWTVSGFSPMAVGVELVNEMALENLFL
jgi:hypothetical protein